LSLHLAALLEDDPSRPVAVGALDSIVSANRSLCGQQGYQIIMAALAVSGVLMPGLIKAVQLDTAIGDYATAAATLSRERVRWALGATHYQRSEPAFLAGCGNSISRGSLRTNGSFIACRRNKDSRAEAIGFYSLDRCKTSRQFPQRAKHPPASGRQFTNYQGAGRSNRSGGI
jgi:hypothetical protein